MRHWYLFVHYGRRCGTSAAASSWSLRLLWELAEAMPASSVVLVDWEPRRR